MELSNGQSNLVPHLSLPMADPDGSADMTMHRRLDDSDPDASTLSGLSTPAEYLVTLRQGEKIRFFECLRAIDRGPFELHLYVTWVMVVAHGTD